MTALLAACRKHPAAPCGLHARTETVRFGAPALARLISALWQSNPPLVTCAPHAKFRRKVSMQNFRCKFRTARHTPPPTKQRLTTRIRGPLRIS
jgi:hypothetical protein